MQKPTLKLIQEYFGPGHRKLLLEEYQICQRSTGYFLKEIEVTNKETLKFDFQFYQNYPVLNFCNYWLLLYKRSTRQIVKVCQIIRTIQGTLQQYELLAPVEYLGKIYFNVNIGNSNQQGICWLIL